MCARLEVAPFASVKPAAPFAPIAPAAPTARVERVRPVPLVLRATLGVTHTPGAPGAK